MLRNGQWPVEWRTALPNPDWKQWKHQRAHDGKWNLAPYVYEYAYKYHTCIQSWKNRGHLYSIVLYLVIIARQRLVHLPIECLMSGRPCLCHQQAFLDSVSWNLRQEDFLTFVPKVRNPKFHWRIEFVCSYRPQITPKKGLVRPASCSSGATSNGQWRRAAVPSTKPRPILEVTSRPPSGGLAVGRFSKVKESTQEIIWKTTLDVWNHCYFGWLSCSRAKS